MHQATFTLCIQNCIKYEYHNDEFGFSFIFNRNVDFLNDKINELDKIIISEIRKNKYITIPELAKKINKSEPTVFRHLEKMIENMIIRRVGSRKAGYWEIQ